MIRLLGHTIFPLCLVLAIFFALVHLLGPAVRQKTRLLLGRTFWFVVSVSLLLVYGAALAFRMWLPVSMDFVEATVVSTAYLALHGHPVYVGLTDPARYSVMYGPLYYLPYSMCLFLLGATFHSLGIALLFLNVALFVVLWFLFRQIVGRSESLVCVAFIAAALMMKSSMTFMIRGDTLLALSVALAIYACSIRPRGLAVGIFMFAGAVAVDIKVTAVFYLLVPAYIFWRRQNRIATVTAFCGMILLALAPFALPGISLASYLVWLKEAAHHPLSPWAFGLNAFIAILAIVPSSLLLWQMYRTDAMQATRLIRRHRVGVCLLLISVAGSVITGSKVGAGRYHLDPTFIVCAYLAALLWSRLEGMAVQSSSILTYAFVVYAVFLILPAVSEMQDMWWLCVRSRDNALRVNADLASILANHPGKTIEMGYDGNPADGEPVNGLTTYRPLLVMAGNPLTIDVGALLDMQLSGVQIPSSTVEYLRSCRTTIWLIPRGNEPFSLLNGYAKVAPEKFRDRHLFTTQFREAFFTNYEKKESSSFYDLWECRDDGNQPAHTLSPDKNG